MRRALAALAAAFVYTAAAPAFGQGGLPPGAGRDLLATACTQCHGLNVITSMRNGVAGWKRHVENMVMRGAQLSPTEADTVVAYLASAFGPGAVPANAQVTLPDGTGKDLVETRCVLCHDLERVTAAKRQRQEWAGLVTSMIGRGAPVTPDEAQTITSYLAAHFGT